MTLKATAHSPIWWGVITSDGRAVWTCDHPHRDKSEAQKCAKEKLKTLAKRRR